MNFKYFKIGPLILLIFILVFILQPISAWIEDLIRPYQKLSLIANNIDALSIIGMITLLLTFINHIGWKWTIFKWLIDLPNLNGRYKGQLISSFKDANGNNVVKNCVLEIKQTASTIHVFAYYGDPGSNTQSSRSYTTSEQIIKESNGLFVLYYIFTNEPDSMSVQLNNHDGTAKFKYFKDIMTLEGEYYNKRSNFGTIKVQFESKRLLGRLIP